MLEALRRWWARRQHGLPATPPRPELTPEEQAVVEDERPEADAEWRPNDPPRGETERQDG